MLRESFDVFQDSMRSDRLNTRALCIRHTDSTSVISSERTASCWFLRVVPLKRAIRRPAETFLDVVVRHDMWVMSSALMRRADVINPTRVFALLAFENPFARAGELGAYFILFDEERDFSPLASRREILAAWFIGEPLRTGVEEFFRQVF